MNLAIEQNADMIGRAKKVEGGGEYRRGVTPAPKHVGARPFFTRTPQGGSSFIRQARTQKGGVQLVKS